MRIRFPVPAVIALLMAVTCRAQEQPADVRQALLDIASDGVLMDLSAHPDDEDGATLAYYRMKYGVRTYSILFTRGEGGQNEKGPELYEELGVLRSRETREAGAVLGTEVHFLNFMDFGYSKTATETFAKWGGEEEAISRLVYVIRKYKPDVLFTNHNPIDGHGNHQAVAITAIAAFDLAADSTYRPGQLREPGVTLWQPRKLFFRAFGRFESAADVSNDINAVDPGRGMTYLDIAVQALRKHRTQGMERANLRAFTRGKSLYRLVRANSLYEQDSTSFFSGVDFFRDPALAPLRPVRTLLDGVHAGMDRDSLLATLSRAVSACDSLRGAGGLQVLALRMLTHWEEDAARLASALCGVSVEVKPADGILVARQRVDCTLRVTSRDCALSGVRWRFDTPPGWVMDARPDASPEVSPRADSRIYTLTVGEGAQPTLPRTVTQYRPIEGRQDVAGTADLLLDGHHLRFHASPAFEISPPLLVEASPAVASILRSRAAEGFSLGYRIRNSLPHKTAGRIGIKASPGWTAENAPFVIAAEDSTVEGTLRVRPPEGIAAGVYTIHLWTDLAQVPVTVHVIDAAMDPGLRVGVIRSQDNTIESATAALGAVTHLITDDELRAGSLAPYTTIVVDIRAYLLRDALRENNARLLDYVRSGGNLVVMYQRDREWKPEYAPYPFRIGTRRVCVEEAPVRMLLPADPLLNVPNRIRAADWDRWIQERALYFPADVPHEYERLVATADPDETPLDTGWLIARYGRGTYMYTCFVWYRELKDGNEGAFRCFANMLAYPLHHPATP
ncbi:MAG TPA: PIG-L family deacetylase [Bacteroidota bacterium]|nr:PIG-L family deacetylase [Bacteroidota bacterium]